MKKYISTELVQKAQSGDKRALRDIILRSDNLIYKTISAFRLATESEDLLQEIRIKIIENLPGLKDPRKYPGWLKALAHNHCINLLKKKRPLLLSEGQEENGGEDGQPSILETEGLESSSFGEFEKYEASLEHKERIEKTAKAVGMEAFLLLDRAYVQGLTLEELVSLGTLKKSAISDKIKIEGARWILEEANQDWNVADYKEARSKLLNILFQFTPGDESKDKRFLLASALSRLGDIHQVQGQIYGLDKSIDFFRRAKQIWDNLRDKKMAAYATHMIALGNNIAENYEQALKILDEAKEGYRGKDGHTKQLLGDLERDTASIYLSMGKTKLAQSQIEKSLVLLETVDHRESYYAALRKKGEIAIKLKHFDRAYSAIEDSIKESPPYRALHHLQAKIAKVELFLASKEINQALKYSAEAEADCKKFGFLHQLSRLHEILSQYAIMRQC
ncbi:MAG: hypothetical protein WCX06_00705 [Candidatus Paceibacterota bacterium]